MPTSHALLSPSASHRWLNCSAAPLLEQTVEDETSIFAEEGTLAHAICESKLVELNSKGEILAEEYYITTNGHSWTEEPLYNPEMEDCSEQYRDIVAGMLMKARETTPDAQLRIEQPLDLTEWIPEGFGTSDAVIVADGTMSVIDYKHGKGVEVSAFENPQMMIYALGAYSALSLEYSIKNIHMTIVQPRIHNLSDYEMSTEALLKWAKNELKPKATLAWRGAHEEVQVDQHPGDWCRFCKVRTICKARALEAQQVVSDAVASKVLTLEEVAEALPKVANIKAWCTDIETYALNQALQGEQINGYKVVEGRSTRVIAQPVELADKLQDAGFEAKDIFKPQELLTITNLEKLVGKKQFNEIAKDYIVKPQGKPTLVPENDKRPAMNSITSDFSHIINNE